MTIKEAKKFFGTNWQEPNLNNLMNKEGMFQDRVHAKVGCTYLVWENPQYPSWITNFGGHPGWNRVVVIARRSGVAFAQLEGQVHKKEYALFEGKMSMGHWVPVDVNLKSFGLNPDFKFIYKKISGVKIY